MDWTPLPSEIGTLFDKTGLIVLLPGEDEGEGKEFDEYSPSQLATLKWFIANEQEVFDALCDALDLQVQEEEKALRRARATPSLEEDEMVYGEIINEDDVADEVADLFDTPEDLDDDWADEEEDDRLITDRFKITTLTLLPGSTPEVCALGFTGHADWEEEHGLGVLMEGLEVQEIGYHDVVPR